MASPRPSARKRGYNRRWEKARATHLKREPFCRLCLERQLYTLATVVDHITPHRGDSAVFWDTSNWQSLCRTCHNGAKQGLEKGGGLRGCDESGVPLDDGHHWNRRRSRGA